MLRFRALTNDGVRQFSEYLASLRDGGTRPIPTELLTDEATSRSVSGARDVEHRGFESRREIATYLDRLLADVDPTVRENDRGLWAWLSLYWLDHICPADDEGRRSPGEDYRHIPSKDRRHYYRHLLLGPWQIYSIHGDGGRCLLSGRFGSHGDFAEQLASRQERIVNPCLIELVDLLYFDYTRDRPKSGATDRKKPGNLRRLLIVMDQFDLTYDLYSMSARELASLLPSEFTDWNPRIAAAAR